MRTLVAQVYEGGRFHENAVTQKRGLINAFAAHGAVHDWDYLDNDPQTRWDGMIIRMDTFQPTHVFTQFHGADILTPQQIAELRQRYPNVKWINFSGAATSHTS